MRRRLSKKRTREQEIYTPYFKIIIIGESRIGKTQLLHRLNGEQFQEKYFPTFGLDFRIKSITLDNQQSCDLQLIDISGEKNKIYETIENDLVKSANAFICVFDISDEYSVIKAVEIKEEYNKLINGAYKLWYLIGTKKDKDIKDNKIPSQYKGLFDKYYEVSSKTSKSTEFEKILEDIVKDLNQANREYRFINNDDMDNEPFELDFEKDHGNVFDEQCEII